MIGGYVVRTRALGGLQGRYFYGDFCTGVVRSSCPISAGRRRTATPALRIPSLSSFGEDLAGALFATSLEGPVYRL